MQSPIPQCPLRVCPLPDGQMHVLTPSQRISVTVITVALIAAALLLNYAFLKWRERYNRDL